MTRNCLPPVTVTSMHLMESSLVYIIIDLNIIHLLWTFLKDIVKSHMNIEKYQAKTSCTLVEFERKWRQFAAALEEEV